MSQLYYISSIHSSDSNTVSDRINYYIGPNTLTVSEEESGILITSNSVIDQLEVIKIDSAMSSMGYLRP
jgi:hypothetical protein